MGVELRYNTNITALESNGDRIIGVRTDGDIIRGDAYLVALASHSPTLLRPVGITLPIYPVKGYSITLPVSDETRAPVSTLLDENYKIAITRLGKRIRVGGMAELTGFDRSLPPRREQTLRHSLNDLFPGAAANDEPSNFWSGLRPMTPDSNREDAPFQLGPGYLIPSCAEADSLSDSQTGESMNLWHPSFGGSDMGSAISLRDDFDGTALRQLARKSKSANQARRLLALAEIYDGGSRTSAARIGGVGLQIVRDWVVRFNARGPGALLDGKAPGRQSLLNDAQRRALVEIVEQGPIPAIHGVVRWRLIDLVQWLHYEFAVSLDVTTVGRELRRLGYVKLTARPRHHTQNELVLEAFKKGALPPSWQRSKGLSRRARR